METILLQHKDTSKEDFFSYSPDLFEIGLILGDI